MPPKLGRVRLVMSATALPSEGVHLEALNTADAVRKAEGVMRAIYPEANRFDSYNTVSELDDSDEVLRFVIGWAKGR
jgi:hypothetical protein